MKTIIKLSGFQAVVQTNQCGDIFRQKFRTCFTHNVPGRTKQPFAWHRCGRDTQYSFFTKFAKTGNVRISDVKLSEI